MKTEELHKKLSTNEFKKYIEKKVRKTIRKYKLCTQKDKIAMAVSGGKDSTVCLYLLKQLGYNIEAVTIDPSIGKYTQINIDNIKEVCKKYDIKLHIVSFREEFGASLCYIRDVLKSKGYKYSSCMICGILKRYLLNKFAKKMKFDCLVTGHNLDDEAQAFLMNIFRSDTKQALKQGPVSGTASSKKFVKRIKPLYLIPEKYIEKYSKLMKFPVNYEQCPCSVGAYRKEYKDMLNNFEKRHPSIKFNIVGFHEKLIMPLKKKQPKVNIASCEICGEATAQEICKTCQLLVCLKTDKKCKKC